jgi:LysM repeat protein
LVSFPEWYGYYLKKEDQYPPIPSYTVMLDSAVGSLADLSHLLGISYHTLKFLNPWLITDKLSNPEKNEYTVTLPKKNVPFEELGENIIYGDTMEVVAQIQAGTITTPITDSTRISCINGKSGINPYNPPPDTAKPKIIVHIVQPGETIECLAETFKVTVDQIRAWNYISDTIVIKPKDELMLFVK